MSALHRQCERFLAGEGDRYFLRNDAGEFDLEERAARDPLLGALRELDLSPRRVLEVGAGEGWRLEAMRRAWPGVRCAGIEPSQEALAAGRDRYPGLDLSRGTAEDLAFEDGAFDLVTLGFCLYLCDRADLFRIAAEVDRVLAPRGCVAILDFHADAPYANPYHHAAGMASYKMDYARLFDWNPAYRSLLRRTLAHDGGEPRPDNLVAVNVLRKDLEAAW